MLNASLWDCDNTGSHSDSELCSIECPIVLVVACHEDHLDPGLMMIGKSVVCHESIEGPVTCGVALMGPCVLVS